MLIIDITIDAARNCDAGSLILSGLIATQPQAKIKTNRKIKIAPLPVSNALNQPNGFIDAMKPCDSARIVESTRTKNMLIAHAIHARRMYRKVTPYVGPSGHAVTMSAMPPKSADINKYSSTLSRPRMPPTRGPDSCCSIVSPIIVGV